MSCFVQNGCILIRCFSEFNAGRLSSHELENVLLMTTVVKELEEEDELSKIPKNLWAVKNIEECNFWFLNTGL